jgi:hypothetical protein
MRRGIAGRADLNHAGVVAKDCAGFLANLAVTVLPAGREQPTQQAPGANDRAGSFVG